MELLKHQPPDSVVATISKVVVYGTIFMVIAAATLLFIDLLFTPGAQTFDCLVICGVAFLYIAITNLFLKQNYYRTVAYLLVLFYMLLAVGIVWFWGINTPIGPLIFTLVIVLAGILLTARCALAAALASGLILVGIQAIIYLGWHSADTSWMTNQSSFGDAFAYSAVFIMLALMSWLYNREMERLLQHTKQAEVALMHQKSILKAQVKERTAELRQVQLEEMQHMYRFAELGHLGVTLLHDLANHLTALTLELESIRSEQHAQTIKQARRIIRYLEKIIDNTRGRLNGSTQVQTFNIIRKVSEITTFLHFKATKARVVIEWRPPATTWNYSGDPDSFSQVIAIIANNAIDASVSARGKGPAMPLEKSRIVIDMQRNSTHIVIRIRDWGKGITNSERKQLFKPHHSTKKSGLGLGLYIAKQITEMQFSGSIDIGRQRDHTEFIIKLPRNGQ